MIAKIYNRKIIVTQPTPPVDPPEPPVGDTIEITVNFASGLTQASSTFPKNKYNKNKAIMFEFDDRSPWTKPAYDKLLTTFYTDGCGNNINYSLGLAVNGRNNFNNAEWGANYPDKMSYTDCAPLIAKGMDIMNHSYYHEPDGNYNFGTDRVMNVTKLDRMMLYRQNYKMNILVVPTNYAGFHIAARDFGYLAGTSQGTFDTFPPIPAQYNAKGLINNIGKLDYYVFKRDFSDNWPATNYSGQAQWTDLNALFAGNTYDFFEIGSHGFTNGMQNFHDWIDSIKTLSNDTTTFTSLREFVEYQYLKKSVTKTELITGNSMKITIDYATALNENISWYDLSLLINSDRAITSVTTNRSDFALTYSIANKLVNIKKRQTFWEAPVLAPGEVI